VKPIVLVTGASGFIGRHLVQRLLQAGCAVRGVVRQPQLKRDLPDDVDVFVGEVQNPSAMKESVAGCDVVFHLAGKAHAVTEGKEAEKACVSVNVEGTRNVLQAAAAGDVGRIVFFSSVKAMGEESTLCLDESAIPNPTTAYGRSKLAAERLVLDHGQQTGQHVVCLRLPLVYGPGNKGNLLYMISAIDRGFFPPFPAIQNRRSMVHVSNVVEAALLAATSPAANGKCYIVTDARAYSTRKLYEMICRELGKQVPQWHTPLVMLKVLGRVGDMIGYVRGERFLFDSDALEKLIGSAWYSSESISRDLGYRPTRSFEDAIPELIAAYRSGCV